ncbi:hypothetical protein SH668x_001237 [Planctomicrobium sp. SH668]|uniref:hypothetical protein n=1 Tax=Planctomicrobium sp. SH668 TaxID=3448126 RepID=UPI003F5AF623
MKTLSDLAGVLGDRGVSEARLYAMLTVGKCENLSGDDLLNVFKHEQEFESMTVQEKIDALDRALDGSIPTESDCE